MIGIDAGHSFDRPPTGVSVYCRKLIDAITAHRRDERYRLFYRSNRYFRSFGERLPMNCSRALLEEFALGITGSGLQVFHGLNQRLPRGLSCPKVATFHDLFVMTSEYSTPEFRQRFTRLAQETAERADQVIAVSQFTAQQVVDLLGVPSERVTAIHHGVDPIAKPSQQRMDELLLRLGIARPFFLGVGAIQMRKNFIRIIEAFEAVGADLDLVLAGPDGFGCDEIDRRIEASPLKRRIHRTGFVTAETRAALYGRARALLFPSLDEGFGLPVLEAFSCGLPVVTSNVSALPEVAGDAALLVDPRDVSSIASAMQRVIEDSELRRSLVEKGTARAKLFTWERAARETFAVYERLR